MAVLNIVIWAVQGVLAAVFTFAGGVGIIYDEGVGDGRGPAPWANRRATMDPVGTCPRRPPLVGPQADVADADRRDHGDHSLIEGWPTPAGPRLVRRH